MFNSVHCPSPHAPSDSDVLTKSENSSSPTSHFIDGKTEAYGYKATSGSVRAIGPERKFISQSLSASFSFFFPSLTPSLPSFLSLFQEHRLFLSHHVQVSREVPVHWAALLHMAIEFRVLVCLNNVLGVFSFKVLILLKISNNERWSDT